MINLNEKSIVICSIVRDAEKGLRNNIPVIERLCTMFRDYQVVVFENNSKDATKQLLSDWKQRDPSHVHALLEDRTEPPQQKKIPTAANPFFSRRRIEKMAALRNQYMEYVDQQSWNMDYMMVVDLDVAQFNLDGILSSFSSDINWDAVTAFGYSTSPKLRRRYHDSYALAEYGEQDYPQTEKQIKLLADKYGGLKPTDDWVRAFSAFGGLAIYRYEAVKGLRYQALPNNDQHVEVRCEHYSIYKGMCERGFDKVYINPAMSLKYQDLTWKIVWNSFKRHFIL